MSIEPNPSQVTEQMFAMVGRAITQWSFVEESLCNVFTICVGSATVHDKSLMLLNHWTPMWIFYSVENFRSKLQMLDAAVTAHLYLAECRDELGAEWARISEKARKLSHKRNKLAHWTVLPAANLGPTEDGTERFYPARLMPPIGSPKYYRETGLNPPGNHLSIVQIGHAEKAFRLLSERVRDFALKLAGTSELADKDVLQALRLLVSHGRLDPTLLRLIRQHLASQE